MTRLENNAKRGFMRSALIAPEILIPGLRIKAGTIVGLTGDGNIGKTFFAEELLIAIATGTPFYWEENKSAQKDNWLESQKAGCRDPMHVMHIDFECGEDETKLKIDRMLNYKRDHCKIPDGYHSINELFDHYYSYIPPGKFPKYSSKNAESFKESLKFYLNEKIDRIDHNGVEKTRVILFDNLAALNLEDENSNTLMSELMNMLRQVAIDFNAIFLIIHHNNKNGSYRGASSFYNSCTAVLSMEKTDDNTITVSQTKKSYYNSVYDVSFALKDYYENKEYEQKFGKSYKLALESSAVSNINLSEEILTVLVSPTNQAGVLKILKAKGVRIGDKKLSEALEQLVKSGAVTKTGGERKGQSIIYQTSEHISDWTSEAAQ